MITCEQITLDGPAASGKSTVARLLAERLEAFYINTGDMYRTLTWLVLDKKLDPIHDEQLIVDLLPKTDIRYVREGDSSLKLYNNAEPVDLALVRSPEVTEQVSYVARISAVREWMVERQRLSAELGLIVMEGRDIGTVVFPEAKYKFYVTASPMVRARRRLAQEGEVSAGASVEEIAADIAKRDELDMNRAISPLKPADDAILIDTSDLDIDGALDLIVSHIN